MQRRTTLKLAAALLTATMLSGGAYAQETIKLGAVAPKTGPLAGGAAVTHWPNIKLWVEEVNGRGGIDVGGTKMTVEVVEYDDQTNPAETIAAVTRLATQDEVDFILAPYSTGLNLAAAPIFDRFGYPQITSSASTDRVEELSGQFNDLFFLLGQNSEIVGDVVAIMSELRDAGTIGNKVAMVNVGIRFRRRAGFPPATRTPWSDRSPRSR